MDGIKINELEASTRYYQTKSENLAKAINKQVQEMVRQMRGK